jgi:hypothetical protein
VREMANKIVLSNLHLYLGDPEQIELIGPPLFGSYCISIADGDTCVSIGMMPDGVKKLAECVNKIISEME